MLFYPSSTPNSSNKRILYLDFIKFFAAFLTVFYHLSYYKLDYGFVVDSTYYPNFSRVVMCLASCCVPLFFIVNGCLMFGRERKVRDVYFKTIKIAFLTFVWSFLEFPSWFFKTLCILYIVFPFFQFLFEKSKKLYYLVCGLVFLFPFTYNLVIMIIKWLGIREIDLFVISVPIGLFDRTGFFTLYSILYFLLGPILSRAKKTSVYLDLMLIISGLALVIFECVIYTNLNGVMFDGVNASFPTIGALLLSTGLFLFFKKFSYTIISKPLLFVSSGIFSIYILHSYIITILPIPFRESLFVSLLAALLICIIGACIGKVASKIPIVCWFFKI